MWDVREREALTTGHPLSLNKRPKLGGVTRNDNTHADTLHQEWLVCWRNACEGKRIYGDADSGGQGLWGVV